jgi:hypothetical protein
MNTGGWADLPDELVAKVLELLQAEEGGLGFSQASATVRLVCSGWKAVHYAVVTRLVQTRETTDEAMGMLVRRFPAVAEDEGQLERTMRVDGQGAASSEQAPCAHVRRPRLLHKGDG